MGNRMERLEDICEHCGNLETECSCYFYFEVVGSDIFEPRFEYAHEHLTNENSVFKRNLPIK